MRKMKLRMKRCRKGGKDLGPKSISGCQASRTRATLVVKRRDTR